MPERVYCPRCAKPAVRGDSATEEIWRCPDQHGIVYKAVRVEIPQEAPQLAAENEPEPEPEEEGEESEGKEDPEPEARARAPAAQHRPPAKKSHAPKKK
jgi:hypothetical protein